jgi:putative acetyltransferase
LDLVIDVDDPRAEDVRALLEAHLAFARESSPPEHVHALDLDGLTHPAVTFFSARRDGVVLGVGAVRRLDDSHAELKSMHVTLTARRQGIGRALLDRLLAFAAEHGYSRVSLETGTMDVFDPARRMYSNVGFRPCEPFAEYTVNRYSACMTIELHGDGSTP